MILALSAFFHPAFPWNVTWIAHPDDLVVIAFLLAARRGAGSVRRSQQRTKATAPLSQCRIPWEFLRSRQIIAAGITLLCMAGFGLGIYVTWYSEESTVVDSLYTPSPLVSAPLRLVKVFEGVLYIFAPVPMFASTWSGIAIASIVYVIAWIVLLRPVRLADAIADQSDRPGRWPRR